MTLFPVPSTTFEILKRGFDAPAQAILLDPLTTSRQIGNDQECFLFILIPIGAQIGLDLIFLPETNAPIKPLSRLVDQIRDQTSWQKTTLCRPMFTCMLGTDTKEIMPAIFLAECDHRKTAKHAISNDLTIRFSNIV